MHYHVLNQSGAPVKKFLEIKRKHHFIWSRYLKSWGNGNDVYYLTKKGSIAFDSVAGLACERDFYKINPLTDLDIAYILEWSKPARPYLRKLHHSYLAMFTNLSALADSYDDSMDDCHLKKVITSNSLENLYSYFESGMLELLPSLAAGNQNVLRNSDSMLKFCTYLGHQISRTKKVKDNSINIVYEKTPEEYKFLADLLEKNWWFISYMLGLNLGMSFFECRKKENHIFITNTTDIPFVTSDNPCVNIHKCLNERDNLTPPEKGDFYFPISPKYAYMINESDEYNYLSDGINEDMVYWLNHKMFENKQYHIFSNTKESIAEVLKNNA